MFKSILSAAAALTILFTSSALANDNREKKTDQNVQTETKQEIKPVVKTQTVKNIWKDMPSYDRYGNEITPRARMNMEQNRKLEKEEANKQNNNLAQEVK